MAEVLVDREDQVPEHDEGDDHRKIEASPSQSTLKSVRELGLVLFLILLLS